MSVLGETDKVGGASATDGADEGNHASRGGEKRGRTAAIVAIYLLGLLVGGLYVGMVAPVRTVVQAQFGLGSAEGIWMINIYSLFYAALIPVIGSLADSRGRKRVFTACVVVFCIGAALCGISAYAGGFALLLVGRVIQAVGACGMIPVANAELGSSVSPDRRGMILGIAAAITGVANVLGSACGSAVLGVFGNENWSMLFFVCLPVGIALAVASAALLPECAMRKGGKLDYAGSLVFVVAVLFLLYALRGIDFLDVSESVANPLIWAALCVAIAGALLFVRVERRADNPVFHLEYLKVRPIVITMAVSFFIGCIIISMTLIPEYAEVLMGNPTGSGGFYVVAIGVTSMFGAPMGGRFIDKFGAKPVLASGLFVAALGYLFLAFAVTPNPTNAGLIVGLMIVGLGMGFAMGAPTNYMILENTDESESASAIATLTFVRQLGTTLAPAIFVGFISGGTLGAGSGAGAAAGVDPSGYVTMLVCIAVFALIGAALTLLYRPSSWQTDV